MERVGAGKSLGLCRSKGRHLDGCFNGHAEHKEKQGEIEYRAIPPDFPVKSVNYAGQGQAHSPRLFQQHAPWVSWA